MQYIHSDICSYGLLLHNQESSYNTYVTSAPTYEPKSAQVHTNAQQLAAHASTASMAHHKGRRIPTLFPPEGSMVQLTACLLPPPRRIKRRGQYAVTGNPTYVQGNLSGLQVGRV